MDKTQADAAADALLEPQLKAQEAFRRKREVEARRLAERRKTAWLMLLGGAVGAAAAYATGERITKGLLWGCVGGSVVGFLLFQWNGWRGNSTPS